MHQPTLEISDENSVTSPLPANRKRKRTMVKERGGQSEKWPEHETKELIDILYKDAVNTGFRNTGNLHYRQIADELWTVLNSCLRNVIEQTFGAWKSRFRMLMQGMNQYNLDTQAQITVACAVLHNFLREYQGADDIFGKYENEDFIVASEENQIQTYPRLTTW